MNQNCAHRYSQSPVTAISSSRILGTHGRWPRKPARRTGIRCRAMSVSVWFRSF